MINQTLLILTLMNASNGSISDEYINSTISDAFTIYDTFQSYMLFIHVIITGIIFTTGIYAVQKVFVNDKHIRNSNDFAKLQQYTCLPWIIFTGAIIGGILYITNMVLIHDVTYCTETPDSHDNYINGWTVIVIIFESIGGIFLFILLMAIVIGNLCHITERNVILEEQTPTIVKPQEAKQTETINTPQEVTQTETPKANTTDDLLTDLITYDV